MKKIFIALTVLACTAVSCNREQAEKIDTQQVDVLYAELLSSYKIYADSLNSVSPTDTTHRAEALLNRFEQHLQQVYKRHPAGLDFHLTQSQNDTLWLYAQRFILARQRHRHNLPQDTVHRDIMTQDTLPQQDSIH